MDEVGAPRYCSRFVCRYGFHEDVFDSVYVPILLYSDVLYQNLDENNNTQTSTDCCTVVLCTSYVNISVTVRVCVCATCSLLGTPILSVVIMWLQPPFSYRNRTPHLCEIFLLRFVIWINIGSSAPDWPGTVQKHSDTKYCRLIG